MTILVIMRAAKSICRLLNCNTLIPSPGYCEEHQEEHGNRFKDLVKAPGSRAFYSSKRWTDTSKTFRERNPLCADHLRQGMVRQGTLVDHKIERGELIDRGLDPCGFEYLETLCHGCHNRKLRSRSSQGI